MNEKWQAFLNSLVPEQRKALFAASAATAKAQIEMAGPSGSDWDMDDSDLDKHLLPPGGVITAGEIAAWRAEQARADAGEIALDALWTGLKIGIMFGGMGV